MQAYQEKIKALSLKLHDLFLIHHQIYVTAESLTAGEISSAIVQTPGSSSYFEGGFVTYSNKLKHDILNVDNSVLESYGAVSEQTVKAMTKGALNQATNATIAVAVSGIAGPDGGTPLKPVGTVWMCVQKRGSDPIATKLSLNGNREKIRAQTTICALEGLIKATLES